MGLLFPSGFHPLLNLLSKDQCGYIRPVVFGLDHRRGQANLFKRISIAFFIRSAQLLHPLPIDISSERYGYSWPFCGRITVAPDKFYKGRSQEKTHLLRLEFFLLRSPLIERNLF
jgi:hypothetical protein